jgi:hypothetical protein
MAGVQSAHKLLTEARNTRREDKHMMYNTRRPRTLLIALLLIALIVIVSTMISQMQGVTRDTLTTSKASQVGISGHSFEFTKEHDHDRTSGGDALTIVSPAQAKITIEESALVRDITPQQLAREADTIVLGTIHGPTSSQWSTQNGELPPGIDLENQPLPAGLFIFTDTPVQVERVLKGREIAPTIYVRTRGGSVGEFSYIAEDDPQLIVDQKVLLFLSSTSVETKLDAEHYIVIEAFQGKFKVEGDQAISKVRKLPISELLAIIDRAK